MVMVGGVSLYLYWVGGIALTTTTLTGINRTTPATADAHYYYNCYHHYLACASFALCSMPSPHISKVHLSCLCCSRSSSSIAIVVVVVAAAAVVVVVVVVVGGGGGGVGQTLACLTISGSEPNKYKVVLAEVAVVVVVVVVPTLRRREYTAWISMTASSLVICFHPLLNSILRMVVI